MADDPRIKLILRRIMDLAAGDTASRLATSSVQDDLDAIATGLNYLAEELEHMLLERRVLHGMLPICSHCNKIRDEQGTWTRLEPYIQDRSHAQFSHGLCDDCAHEHYGGGE